MVVGPAALAADASGAALAFTCYGCHGYDGLSKGAAPSLKGLPADYLSQAMKDFKSGKRPATIMGRIAKGYSDGEIAAMSEYLATLK
jgi:sulfide dehydrogenase cytochrome subunit